MRKITKLKANYPYICNFCGKFTHISGEYCENCGTFSSLRDAQDSDYTEINIREQKLKTHSVSLSHFKSGFILSIIGGLSSIAMGFWLELVVPNLALGLAESFIIIQAITIIGGIITLIGVAFLLFKAKVGTIIILISGIVAGGNIITIIGAINISKKIKKGKR